MNAVRVINVKGVNKPEDRSRVTYVGRRFAGWPRHRLCNPVKPGPRMSLEACLDCYRRHLANGIRDLDGALAALWEECEHGIRPLGCWCVNAVAGDGSPVVCHAQILGEMLRERFCCKAVQVTDDDGEAN